MKWKWKWKKEMKKKGKKEKKTNLKNVVHIRKVKRNTA